MQIKISESKTVFNVKLSKLDEKVKKYVVKKLKSNAYHQMLIIVLNGLQLTYNV